MDDERREYLKKLKTGVMISRQRRDPDEAARTYMNLPASIRSRLAGTSKHDVGYIQRKDDTDNAAYTRAEAKRLRRAQRNLAATARGQSDSAQD